MQSILKFLQFLHAFLRLDIALVNMNYHGYLILVVALLAPTSQIRVSATLPLPTAGNQKLRTGSGLRWMTYILNLIKIRPALEFKHRTDGRTDMSIPVCVPCEKVE
jgi:hypothetical protein